MKDFVKSPKLDPLFILHYRGNSEHVRLTVYRTYRTRKKDYYILIEKAYAYQKGIADRLFSKVEGDLKEEIIEAVKKHASDKTLEFLFVDRKLLRKAKKDGLDYEKDGLERAIEKLVKALNKS